MAPGPKGIGGGREVIDPTRGYEGRVEGEAGRVGGVLREQSRPGAETLGGAETRLPQDVRKAAEDYEAMAERPGEARREKKAVEDRYNGDDPGRVPMRDSGDFGLLKWFRWFRGGGTKVVDLAARRTSDAHAGPEAFDTIRLADGTVALVKRGQAQFVSLETVKERVAAIENETPWGETRAAALARKTAEFSKTTPKPEAAAKAEAWYQAAAARRASELAERVADLLPAMSKKYRNSDMAKYQAELKAKAEWDEGLKNAKKDLPVIVDTSIPGMGYDYLRVVDHHGPFLKKPDGSAQKANATMQLMNRFEDALRASGAKDVTNPTDAQVREAMTRLNLKEVATDNLADGAWSVWMARNQSQILKNPELRALIREATYFEDFTAFSQGKYDRGDPAIELQAALFAQYGRILRENGIAGSDRIPADKAEAIMADTLKAMDAVLANPTERARLADAFWENVDAARAKAEAAVIHEAQVDGRTVVKFYDMAQLNGFTVFEQWLAVPDIYRQRPQTNADGSLKLGADGFPLPSVTEGLDVQVTVAPMPKAPDGGARSLPIVAIPFGNKVGGRRGLLVVVDALNRAEKAKADALGVPANFWFGKESVVLPNPAGGGSRLTPKEIADIVTDPSHQLFAKAPGAPAPGKGEALFTADGQRVAPLNPSYAAEVHGYAGQRSYAEGAKLINEYGVGRDAMPRAKGERLAELAARGDARASEALELLVEIKREGDVLVGLSSQPGSGEQWIAVPTARLRTHVERFRSLMTTLAPALEGATVPVSDRPALKSQAQALAAEYAGHRTHTDGPIPVGTLVDAYVHADGWAVQGNASQQRAARDVLDALESNPNVLTKIAALEKALEGDALKGGERERAERTMDDLYGILQRNQKTIETWKSYEAERKAFDGQISAFELPFVNATLTSGLAFFGIDAVNPFGVVEVSTQAPRGYEDLGAVGKNPGDYAVTIWVKTPGDQSRILGDVWSQYDPSRVKWQRDAQGRFLRIADAQGRLMDVHVQVVPEAGTMPEAAPKEAPADAVPYDMAARRVSNSSRTEATVPGVK